MCRINIGSVRTFEDTRLDKAQALKPLEEAAEVFGAWQRLDETKSADDLSKMLDECADVIQATANLMRAAGVEDATYLMLYCEGRNERRGRYGLGDNESQTPEIGD